MPNPAKKSSNILGSDSAFGGPENGDLAGGLDLATADGQPAPTTVLP